MDRYFTCYKNILHLFSNSYCQDNNFSPNLRTEGVLFKLKFYGLLKYMKCGSN
jgi:hypothetical protein